MDRYPLRRTRKTVQSRSSIKLNRWLSPNGIDVDGCNESELKVHATDPCRVMGSSIPAVSWQFNPTQGSFVANAKICNSTLSLI